MLTRLLRRRLDRFERAFATDASHMRQVLAASPRAFLRFARVQVLGNHREDLPMDPWFAAKLVATLHEDCGPCTQLVADMALAAKVPAATVRAVIAGRTEAMDQDVRLAYQFSRAVLARDPGADQLRTEVLARWGPRALVSLAFSLCSSRMYPTLKYALGHGRACTIVRVGGEEQRPAA
jgi:hypothetical protein